MDGGLGNWNAIGELDDLTVLDRVDAGDEGILAGLDIGQWGDAEALDENVAGAISRRRQGLIGLADHAARRIDQMREERVIAIRLRLDAPGEEEQQWLGRRGALVE